MGLILIWLATMGVTLPQTGPAPAAKPPAAEDKSSPAETPAQPPLPSGTTPTPSPDPRDGTGQAPATAAPPTEDETAPDTKPKPDANPKPDAATPVPDEKPEAQPEVATPPPPPDRKPESEPPDELALCLKDLKAIGAEFREEPEIDDESGCGIAHPVRLSRVLPDIALEPEATLRCETALSLARMVNDMLIPAAARAFPDKPKLSGITQASGYVCRNRNSAETGKISEHAHGNAIDIAGLSFGNEKMPMMIARQDDGSEEAAFQRAFNALACLYFTTVLSPGSDPTHQDHMHLDVIERKSGFRYCR
jgi:hypothetical protein